jgi:hypothetical protein
VAFASAFALSALALAALREFAAAGANSQLHEFVEQ